MTPQEVYDYILKELLQDKYYNVVKKPLFEYNSLYKTYINEIFNQHLEPLVELFINKYDFKKDDINIEYIPHGKLFITVDFNTSNGRNKFEDNYTLYDIIKDIKKYTGFKIVNSIDNIYRVRFTIDNPKIIYLEDELRNKLLQKLENIQKPKDVDDTVWTTQRRKVRNEI